MYLYQTINRQGQLVDASRLIRIYTKSPRLFRQTGMNFVQLPKIYPSFIHTKKQFSCFEGKELFSNSWGKLTTSMNMFEIHEKRNREN